VTDKTDRSTRPKALPVIVDNIPQTLKNLPQWLGWRWEWKTDKEDGDKGAWTKPPVNLRTGGYGISNNADTWSDFETAVRVLQNPRRGFVLDGIGFALQPSNGIAGIDWDKVVNQDTGEVKADVLQAIQVIDSYTERSPSGLGYRAFVLAKLPPTERRSGDIEIYNSGRYLTVTGHRIDGTQNDIMPRQAQIDAYHAEVFREKLAMRKKPYSKGHSGDLASLTLSDREALAMARKAKNGHQFARLFDHGDLSAYGDDHSSADLALCNMLAFWCGGDETQIDRLFRESALYREKWDRPDYRTRTIELALLGRTVFYTKQVPTSRKSNSRKSTGGSVVCEDTATSGDDIPAEDSPAPPVMMGDDLYEGLPEIEVKDRQLRHITADAIAAIIAGNDPPEVFVSHGALARLERDPETKALFPSPLGVDSLTGILARRANWFSDSAKEVIPPQSVVRDVLTCRLWGGIPVLRSIVTSPVLTRQNTLLTQPGYDAGSGLYYHDNEIIPIADRVTWDAYEEARSLIFDEMLGDFPFQDEASKANAVAFMLLPILRHAIDGPTPMTIFDAPTPGTGKSLLVEIILALYAPQGSPARACPAGDNDDEWRKAITSAIVAKSQFYFLDNVKGALYNAPLQAAITSTSWTDRILGASEQRDMRHSMIFVATANNIAMDNEQSRRVVWVRLDANEEHPETRTGFRHPNIKAWVLANRPRLLAALLTIVQAWIDGGCKESPVDTPPLGSFEAYVKLMSAVMAYAMPGFLQNRQQQMVKSVDVGPWHAFVSEWYAQHKTRIVGTADLFALGQKHFAERLGDKSETSQKNKLARLLTNNADRVFDGLKIASLGPGDTFSGTQNVVTFRILPQKMVDGSLFNE